MVRMVEGDLFDPNWNFEAIGHGVNCKGVMGSGIAPLFKNRYPTMYKKYRLACDNEILIPGQVMPYYIGNKMWVYNIASQYLPGANADYRFLRVGLEYVRFHMQAREIESLGLPWIGAGIGGLAKEGVLEVVSDVFKNSGVDPTIVSLPE